MPVYKRFTGQLIAMAIIVNLLSLTSILPANAKAQQKDAGAETSAAATADWQKLRENIQKARGQVRQAQQAYQKKDYATFLTEIQQAATLRPDHPSIVYNYASANALAGDKQLALKLLTRFADFGAVADIAADNDFATLKDSAEFSKLVKRIEANRQPIGKGTIETPLAEKDLITEGLAYDSSTTAFYLGSVHKRKIVRLDKQGKTTDFVTSGQDGLWGVFGLRVDSERRLLWATSANLPQVQQFNPSEDGQAGLFKYDLTTGKLIKKYLPPANSGKHVWGDLTVGRNGEVYLTDSVAPQIYHWNAQKDALELIWSGAPFISLQGVALNAAENKLLVADYALGLFSLDLTNKKLSRVTHAENISLLGIDGIYRYLPNGSTAPMQLIAVQNGFQPRRIVRLTINSNADAVTELQILEADAQRLPDPTLGVIVGQDFYFNANAQWDNFGDDGKVTPLEKFQSPTILKTSLK
jgi:hypothetical protein